jgi:hypothetical protein
MRLSKSQFFFLLLPLVLAPFILYTVIWLMGTDRTTGKVQGIGSSTEMNIGQHSYALISFRTATDTIWFQGHDENYKEGDVVPVRYKKNNPSDAKVVTLLSIWGDTMAYGGVALIFWAVCFLSKDLVPKNAWVVIGQKPFIKLMPRWPKRNNR